MLPPFFLTLSRSSYIGFIGQSFFHSFATPKRQVVMFFGIAASVILLGSVPKLRDAVTRRVEYTFQGAAPDISIGGKSLALEASALQRIQSWEVIVGQKFPLHPIFGWGVSGVGLVDVYYPLILGETGLVGFCLFLWLLKRVWSVAWNLFKLSPHAQDRALSLGLLTALVGVGLHSFGANSFIIVRIMEPFWFTAALVARLYIETMRERRDSAENESAQEALAT
jgi:O-antigen ligase